MVDEQELEQFLSAYPLPTKDSILAARAIVLSQLPGISETIDHPARLLAYAFGNTYKDMVCVLIPSQKDAKLSFSKGARLADDFPGLTGNGKLTRFVSLLNSSVDAPLIADLLKAALSIHSDSDTRRSKTS